MASEPVIVRTYHAPRQQQAAALLAADLPGLVAQGYVPTSQSWQTGHNNLGFIGSVLIALGYGAKGSLVVTFSRR
jgi:hypothetical protein